MQAVRGFQDIQGNAGDIFLHIINKAHRVANSNNFQYVNLPTLEFAELYERNIGKESDIVHKEIYKFADRRGEMLALRPELTAGTVRFFLEKSIYNKTMPQKFFSYGPVFRYDRPQMGRYRQFHQVNFETFGASNPKIDVECILAARDIFEQCNIDAKNYNIEINTIGNYQSRIKYETELVRYLKQYKDSLSKDSQRRIEARPLRILDSKDKMDQDILSNAPSIKDYLTNDERLHFEKIVQYLDDFKISYKINYNLVRGLDYYDEFVFEFTTKLLGAQTTILGGGRYNELIKKMSNGSVDISAIGFAAGVERLMLIINTLNSDALLLNTVLIVVIYYSEQEYTYAANVMKQFRDHFTDQMAATKTKQVKILLEFNTDNTTLSKKMNRANKIGGRYVIICGPTERTQNTVTIKNLKTGSSSLVSKDDAMSVISRDINENDAITSNNK